MPTYRFRDEKSKKIEEVFMSISEMEDHLKNNPTVSLVPAAPAIVSGVDGLRRPDNAFRDLLRKIKKNNRGSNINIR